MNAMTRRGLWLILLGGLLAGCSPGVYLDECPEGMVVDGVCRPSDCASVQCPAGFICEQDQCLEVACLNTVCAANEACAHGVCYPSDCERRTCPGVGEVCVDEECQPASCVNVDCPAGQECAAGLCYPTDCDAQECPGFGEVCVDGQCVERTCVGVTCPTDQKCAGGFCFPIDCNDIGCYEAGEVCVDGTCVRTACVGVECETGLVCANGYCYPPDCGAEDCSDFGEVCYQDRCVPADCVLVDCPAGEECAQGTCLPVACGGVTCPDGYVCYQNVCERQTCVGVQCPVGQDCADGQCLPADCTNVRCADDEICVAGRCVPDDCAHTSCPAGETCASDGNCYPSDCPGGCLSFEVCVGGVCTDQLCVGVTCPAPQLCAAGNCYDPDCTTPCDPGYLCEAGTCVPEECAGGRCCPPMDCTTDNQCATYLCDGVSFTCLFDGVNSLPAWSDRPGNCTDLDPCTVQDSCSGGACAGTDMVCDPGETCVAGVCRCGVTGPDCINNETCCTTECFDLDTHIDNCGGCGVPCRRDHATPACVGGVCQIGTCDALWDSCDGQDANGCETSLETLTDCAACGVPCSASNATVSCVGGSCHVTDCDTLWGDCNNQVGDGCEQTLTTLVHCAACDTPCSRAHASATCVTGACLIDTCDALWDDCDTQDPNGCETSLETVTDCNACNVSCSRAHATATCAGGTCLISTCDALWDDCNGTDGDGCETSLETLTDCNACGVSCSRNHATATCAGGACLIGFCDALWGDCNVTDADGCEQTLTTLVHCGGCNVPCTLNHATATDCTTGSCQVVSCQNLWDDCDNQDPNGCETSLETLGNCNACFVNCSRAHATATCAGGTCLIATCDALWDNCNHIDGDGCEISLQTLSDCGGCGVACSRNHATASCAGGSCHISTCDSLWGNCNGSDPDGCEVSLTSLTNCGACGVPCSLPHATETCATGSCLITSCDGNYYDVDNADPNGCECGDTSDSADTCGGAGGLGTVSAGNPTISVSGVLVQGGGRNDQDCFSVAYSSPNPGSGTFRIRFSNNPGGLQFRVWKTNCSNSVCGGDTTFTSDCSSTGGACQSGNSDTYTACVYAPSTACANYTLVFERI